MFRRLSCFRILALLHIYQGNRLERLAERLAGVLCEAPLAPTVPETVVVPGRGLERWLRLYLAAELGICAHIQFPLPAVFAWELLRTAWRSNSPGDSPGDLPGGEPPPLAWRMLKAFEEDTVTEAPWQGLPHGGEARALLALQLAEVFSQYLVYRPDWLLHWEQATGTAPPEAGFQAPLWRRLSTVDHLHWARQSKELLDRAAAGQLSVPAWPSRVSLFALPELSPRYLQLLNVLAHHSEVHLFVLNPCQEYWGDIVTPAVRERAAVPYMEEGNRLLAVLGRQGRNMQELLLEHCAADAEELFEIPTGEGVLPQLQRELLQLRDPDPGGAPRQTLDAADARTRSSDPSLTVHSCHSPLREVEVLHDRLLSLFDSIPGLQPAQVAVTAPDFSAYTGCLDAVFRAAPTQRYIPCALSGGDTALEEVFRRLLRLPRERIDSHYVLDLLEVPALRNRFDLEEEDLNRIRSWLPVARVGWGLHEGDWSECDLPLAPAHTWRAALDRLSLGYALPLEGECFKDLSPVPVLGRDGLKTLDGLSDLLATLDKLRRRLGQEQTPAQWVELLRDVIVLCLKPAPGREGELTLLRSAVSHFERAAHDVAYEGKLELEAMLVLLDEYLSPSFVPSPVDGVVCAPMAVLRGIPFKVVCVLGLNEGSLPRPLRRLHFDLLRDSHRRGDRSPRDNDRGLFLDALLSARHHLHLSYVGRRVRDDMSLTPARPLQELLEYLERSYPGAEFLRIQHPLHPFSHRCFDPAAPLLHSHAEEFCPEAPRSGGLRSVTAPFFPVSVPESGQPVSPPAGFAGLAPGSEIRPEKMTELKTIELSELIEFFQDPARYLLRGRLSLSPPRQEESLPQTEPFQLGGLRRYQVRALLLEGLLAGRVPGELQGSLCATGLLPPGAVGRTLLQSELIAVRRLADPILALPAPGRECLEEDFTLEDWKLRCRLTRLGGAGVLHYRAGRLRPKDEIALWLEHLAWSLAGAKGASLGLGLEKSGELARCRLAPLSPGDAGRFLRELLELYQLGCVWPLPCPPGQARALGSGRKPSPQDLRETDQWFFRTAFRGRDWEREEEFTQSASIVWGPLRAHQQENS